MSLDTLFQQILRTEQQLTEQTHKLKDVKAAIARCSEEIRSAADVFEKTSEELDRRAQRLSVMRLQADLMKKHKHQIRTHMEELLGQKNHLRERLAEIKSEAGEEETNFLQQISRFNGDFSLRGDGGAEPESRTHADILDLQDRLEELSKEMEAMKARNGHMSSMQEEKRGLQLQLQDLDSIRTDLDLQLSEAALMTESLRAEGLSVSQKPLTDSTCLRLRTELEMHKEGELELLKEALGSEIHFLQSKLDSSQQSERL